MNYLLELSRSEWLYKHERDFVARASLSKRIDKNEVGDYYKNIINARMSDLVSDMRSEQILEELSYQYPTRF